MKENYYHPKMMRDVSKYNPAEPVLEGSKLWEARRALNEQFGSLSSELFDKKKAKLYAQWGELKGGRKSPMLLSLKLKHGDFMVMHGADIQKYYEVSPSMMKEPNFTY